MTPRTHRHRHARRGETRRQRKRADVKRSAATRAQRTNCCQHDGTTQTKMAAAPAGAACSRQKEIPGGGGRTTDWRGEFRVLSTNHIPSARAKRFPRGPLRLRFVGACLFFIPYGAFVPGEAPHREGYIYFGSERSGRSTTLGGGDRSGRVISWSLSVRSRASHLAIPLIRASKDTKNS